MMRLNNDILISAPDDKCDADLCALRLIRKEYVKNRIESWVEGKERWISSDEDVINIQI